MMFDDMPDPVLILARQDLLRSQAHAFCSAFSTSSSSEQTPQQILDTYFRNIPNHYPIIHEHGPAWSNKKLPFLGKEFVGRSLAEGSSAETDTNPGQSRDTCDDYFTLLSQTLAVENAEFPASEEYTVDTVAPNGGAVSVVGVGTFKSVKTGKTWEEQFTYRLSGFDIEGKIGKWEIWADPLSAWNAIQN
jgi:hypothetical protein